MIKVLIYWHEYPVCATRIDSLDESIYDVKVYSSKPKVPFRDFKSQKFSPIYLDYPSLTASTVIEANPSVDILIITGWAHKVWIEIAQYYKLKGAKIVMMVDNNLRFTPRQLIGSFLFKMMYGKIPDFYMVPGVSASRLLQFFGVKASKIYRGYYGFTSSYFQPPETSIECQRKKSFVFVGQKTRRKGIDILCKSYAQYRNEGGDWDLIIIGSGSPLPLIDGVKEYGFMQPREISELFKTNMAFILPSRLDHWGTVVAEAASSGMIPIVSNAVGAAEDIVFNGINGFIFDKSDVNSLAMIMHTLSSYDGGMLKTMSQRSVEISSMYSEKTFSDAVRSIASFGCVPNYN